MSLMLFDFMTLLDNIIILLSSLFDLLKGGFLLSLPVFVLVLIGQRLKREIDRRWKLSWVQSTLLTTYIIATLLILVLYFGVYAYSLQFYSSTNPPEAIQPVPEFVLMESLLFVGFGLAKKLVAGLAVSLMILPLAVIGSVVLERLEARDKGRRKKERSSPWLKLFGAVFVATLLAYIVVLIFDFIPVGVVYLVFNF